MAKLNIPSFNLCTKREHSPEKLVKLAKMMQENTSNPNWHPRDRYSLATLHGLGALVNLVAFLLAPPALLRLGTVRSGVTLFAAVVALVRFRAVILHMTLRANM